VFAHPDNPNLEVTVSAGTGTLISDRHVLTVAHNVYAEIRTPTRSAWQKAKRVTAFPARDKDFVPFGGIVSRKLDYPDAWRDQHDDRYDFALITLDEAIGQKKFKPINNERLGWWGSKDWGEKTIIKPLSKSQIDGQIVNLSGYPKIEPKAGVDISAGVPWRPQQWWAYDRVHQSSPTIKAGAETVTSFFSHLVDATVGQSGSPLWILDSKTGERNLVGLHKGGCLAQDGCRPAGSTGPAFNLAIHITQNLLDHVQVWMRG
jgi:glutamyl endopeptidase